MQRVDERTLRVIWSAVLESMPPKRIRRARERVRTTLLILREDAAPIDMADLDAHERALGVLTDAEAKARAGAEAVIGRATSRRRD